MASSERSAIISSFGIYGYSLRSEALQFMLSVLNQIDEAERSAVLHEILDYLQNQSLESSLIEKSMVEQAVEASKSAKNEVEANLTVVNAFSMQAFCYNYDAKKFVLRKTLSKSMTSLYGNPELKSGTLLERYKMIHQRTLRHRLFAPPAIVTDNKPAPGYSLKCIEYLLGATPQETNLIVLGMLAQLKEGEYFLEDPTGAIKMNLSAASFKNGLFTENCIILAEGYCEGSVFHVTNIGFPPPEPASVTLTHFPYLDPSVEASTSSYRLSKKLKQVEEKHSEAMFIFLADVWLDNNKIMQKLQILFAGYSEFPPTCFVLIGNFLSNPASGSCSHIFKESFEKLGDLIADFPSLVSKTTFIFVPGPDDPSLPHILPRPRLPKALLSEFVKKVPNSIFASNPCRLKFCSQEIVIFREDMVAKMSRNSIYMPWQDKENIDIPNLFVKTIMANSHLLPLPSNVAPTYWEYDHAFWLYPLPDIVVCADKGNPYTITNAGCTFINPGSLPWNSFSFKVYVPAHHQVEDSQITDEHLMADSQG